MINGTEALQIVVVDDEPFFRKLMRDVLEDRGYSVLVAASGLDVPDLVARYNVGVVLADIEMPDLSGAEVLRRVKRLRPEVPVIMVSAHQDFAHAHEVLRDGALDYLVKPIDREELYAAVERAFTLIAEARAAAAAVRDAQLRLADLVLLREVGETVGSEANQQQLLDRILELTAETLQVEIISIMLPGEDGLLRISSARGLAAEIVSRSRCAPGEGVAGYVYSTGKPVLIGNIERDGRFTVGGREIQYNTRSLLTVPIRAREQMLGVLNVNNKRNGESFTAFDLNLLSTIAYQTALALENFKLIGRLRRQTKDLEQVNRDLRRHQMARSQLVYNLSQQLTKPLAVLRNNLEQSALEPELAGSGRDQSWLQTAQQEVAQLDRVLSGMLCLFSLDSGGAEWQLSTFSLETVILEALSDRRDDINGAGIDLEFYVDEALSTIFGDRAKTVTLLVALLDNAIKFNRPGGRIVIQLANCVTDGLSYVYLQLHNDGRSIPEHAASAIFEHYTQLGGLEEERPAGHGLGLPICRAIVARMKGKIFLEPIPGEGTTFGVLLPTRDSYGVMTHEQSATAH